MSRITGLFRRWENAVRAETDARALLAQHGAGADEVARDIERAVGAGELSGLSRPAGHWGRVRIEIRRVRSRRCGRTPAG